MIQVSAYSHFGKWCTYRKNRNEAPPDGMEQLERVHDLHQ